ncbi:phosphohydrolase [Nocardia sp. SYP-A9097]|uniref:metallophosphoesterase family protein n=1 Tax=Nocardia sp. SYP-A9097 TaxID=2663237 RepID=UPI00129A2ADE|nr:metallophosphoesterase [Nocardia sp. SYP-A9097]MRH88926.1 phosphohydrolase [Nocardia sp. SYP-A9097]
MSCCGPNRRRVLGAFAAAALLPLARPVSVRAQVGSVVATDLEVVTITEQSAVLTWTTLGPNENGDPVPVETDTEVWLGPVDGALRQVFADAEPTAFHYADVTGLEPGRRYRFEARSFGVPATPALNVATRLPNTPEATGEFTTAVPPPGRLLRTIALANDVHYGEEISGLITAGLPPGVRQEPGLAPYPEVMLAAILDDLHCPDRAADHLLIAGDLTAEATPDQVAGVHQHLASWGTADRDWFACRGNHDRPHLGSDYASCEAYLDHFDCWGESFTPRQRLGEFEVGELRLLALDTTELDSAGGTIDHAQFDRLREVLLADPDRPTLVFSHHPVTTESGWSNLAGPGFILNAANSAELQALYRSAPGVFLHHSGHTHRNRRTRPDLAIPVEFLEVAAAKEYPGGYSLLRIYEGGYTVNFHKTRTANARRWSARSRGEYFGLLPEYTLGATADRNHTVLRDFSGLARAQ